MANNTFKNHITIGNEDNSNTWIQGTKEAMINIPKTLDSTTWNYLPWIRGSTKNGNISFSTYPGSDDTLYIGYAAATKTGNSFDNSLTWNGSTGVLTAIKFKGPLEGNATSATTATNLANAPTLTKTGTSTIDLTANTTYTLTVGGKSVIFKTPNDANTNTTYTFTGGTNSFTVTPSGGTAQSVTVTPSITQIKRSATTSFSNIPIKLTSSVPSQALISNITDPASADTGFRILGASNARNGTWSFGTWPDNRYDHLTGNDFYFIYKTTSGDYPTRRILLSSIDKATTKIVFGEGVAANGSASRPVYIAATGQALPISSLSLTGNIVTSNTTAEAERAMGIYIKNSRITMHAKKDGSNYVTTLYTVFNKSDGSPVSSEVVKNVFNGSSITSTFAGNATTATTATYLAAAPKLEATGTSTINLTANTTYTLTIGGKNVVFKTPGDNNTDTKVNVIKNATTRAYILGTTSTPTNTAAAVTTIADTGVYLGTTAGTLYATTFYGNLSAGNITCNNKAIFNNGIVLAVGQTYGTSSAMEALRTNGTAETGQIFFVIS